MTNGSAGVTGNMLIVEPEVVASPLKQEILRLNEENYYLKLEVIKLVSTLKGTGSSLGESKKRKLPTESEDSDSISVRDSPYIATPNEIDCFSLIDIPPDTPLEDNPADFKKMRQLPLSSTLQLDFPPSNDTNDFLFIDSNDVENTFNAFIAS